MACVRITDVKNSCESFTEVKDSNVFVTAVRNTFEFFTLETDSFDFHIWTNLSHVWSEELVCICHTCEKFKRILHRSDKYVRILHTSKLDICEKLVPIKISKLAYVYWRMYISHIPKCDVFVRMIHNVWKIWSVNIKVPATLKVFSGTSDSDMSRLMTKPKKWLCAQRRLRSARASTQSDQSLRCPHEESLGP